MPPRNPKSKRSKGRKVNQFVAADSVELLPPTRVENPVARWGPMILVAVVSFLVYIPAIDNDFVTWDDDHYIFDNRQVSEPDGLKSIWFDVLWYSEKRFQRTHEKRVSHQYYPLLFSMFWLEYRLFGGDDSMKVVDHRGVERSKTIDEHMREGRMTAAGFHVSSMVLHALAGVILIALFRCLGVSNWVAWAAAILFGVHPMQASSVAWAAEVKNILSLIFYMLAMMAYVKHRRTRNWWFYGLSLVAFQAALFSKTVALTLPVMLFFTDRLLERRWDWRFIQASVLRVIPFLALSLVAAMTTMSVEDRQRTIPIEENERLVVAGSVLLFYPYKMLFPVDQTPIYPLWDPDITNIVWWLPLLASIGIAALIFRYRRKLGPHFVWAAIFYFVMQFPMLGLKNINYFQFAFVADHYFYHGSVGLFLMLALGVDFLRKWIEGVVARKDGPAELRAGSSAGPLKTPSYAYIYVTCVIAAATIALGVRTWYYCDHWQTRDTFWERVIAKNPGCWPAYYNTANERLRIAAELRNEGKVEEAKELALFARGYYEKVAELHTKIRQPFDQLIRVALFLDDNKEAMAVADQAAKRFGLSDFHQKACEYATRAGLNQEAFDRCDAAASLFERSQNIESHRKTIADCRINASTAASRLGNWKEAYSQAVRAIDQCVKAKKPGAEAKAQMSAGRAAMQLERYDDAITHLRRAGDLYAQTRQPAKSVQAYALAAEASRRKGDQQGADALLRKSIDVCMMTANLAIKDGKPDRAGQAYLQAARVAREAGWNDEAVGYYRQSGENFVAAGDRLANSERICNAVSQYRAALRVYGQLLELSPQDPVGQAAAASVREMLVQSKEQCAESKK